jgi:two-component system NarL family response regulator
MSEEAKIRIAVADDHHIVRDGLVGIINAQKDMVVIGEAEDGESAARLILDTRPDVAMVDLSMPKLDGVQVIERVRAAWPTAKIILLTTYDTDDDIERGIRAGACAYQLKDVRAKDLMQCVRDVNAGKTIVSPTVAAKLARRLTQVQLTRREVEVLRLLSDGKANKEIASTLFISESTVKLHINSLFEKLGVSSRTEAMKAALQRGLIRLPEYG